MWIRHARSCRFGQPRAAGACRAGGHTTCHRRAAPHPSARLIPRILAPNSRMWRRSLFSVHPLLGDIRRQPCRLDLWSHSHRLVALATGWASFQLKIAPAPPPSAMARLQGGQHRALRSNGRRHRSSAPSWQLHRRERSSSLLPDPATRPYDFNRLHSFTVALPCSSRSHSPSQVQ